MASSSSLLANTKRRSQSSPELLLSKTEEDNTAGNGMVGGEPSSKNTKSSDSIQVVVHEDPSIPVDAVTVINRDSCCNLTNGNTTTTSSKAHSTCRPMSSTRKTNSTKTRHNSDTEKQKSFQTLQNGAFAHNEANLITVEYSTDDGDDCPNKQKPRSRLDLWQKLRTIFRSKDKECNLEDKENRVMEASDSEEENNCVLSDFDKCHERGRSESFYGRFRNYVRNKDTEESDEKTNMQEITKKNNTFCTEGIFARKSRSRSRSKKSKRNTSQPPPDLEYSGTNEHGRRMLADRHEALDGVVDNRSNFVGAEFHILTPIEQAELLDSGLSLPSGARATEEMDDSPSVIQSANTPTIVTQDLYGQFGSHTQNGYKPRTVHTQIDYIHCLVPSLKSILDTPCYWGKINRYQADSLLENKPEGTYLLRDSAQEEFLFSVSFRRYGRSLHARLEQWSHRFSFDAHDPGVFSSDTVTGLLEHYKDPNCCMFFEPMLTTPLPRSNSHSLQALCRGVICTNIITYDAINCLKVPPMFKEYLREYHYKQRVRVRRFEIDYVPQPAGQRQTFTNTCISY